MASQIRPIHVIVLSITTIGLPIMIIYGVTAFLGGTKINIGHSGIATYPVSEPVISLIKFIAVIMFIPLSIAAHILSILNMIWKKDWLNTALIVFILTTIVWLFVTFWALNPTYVEGF